MNKFATCVTTLLSCLNAAEILEFKAETNPQEEMDKFEYAVINFYDSTEDSQDTKKVFELAHSRFTSLEEEGSINNRDVGWFNCNIDEHPELKINTDDGPHVVVTHRDHIVRKQFDYVPSKNIDEMNGIANIMMDAVWELTGNWIPEVTCDDIMSPDWIGGNTLWDLVYFGSKASLEKEIESKPGRLQYQELILASMVDRYEYHDESHTAFHINNDPECAKKLNLDVTKSHLVLYTRNSEFRTEPFVFTDEPGQFTIENISYNVNVSILRAMPRWSKRAYSTLSDMHANAIVFMVPDLKNPEELVKDWRYEAFAEIVEMTMNAEDGLLVPLLTTFDHEDLGHAGTP